MEIHDGIYHKGISKNDAVNLLAENGNGSFLIRDSSNQMDFALSVLHNKNVASFLIKFSPPSSYSMDLPGGSGTIQGPSLAYVCREYLAQQDRFSSTVGRLTQPVFVPGSTPPPARAESQYANADDHLARRPAPGAPGAPGPGRMGAPLWRLGGSPSGGLPSEGSPPGADPGGRGPPGGSGGPLGAGSGCRAPGGLGGPGGHSPPGGPGGHGPGGPAGPMGPPPGSGGRAPGDPASHGPSGGHGGPGGLGPMGAPGSGCMAPRGPASRVLPGDRGGPGGMGPMGGAPGPGGMAPGGPASCTPPGSHGSPGGLGPMGGPPRGPGGVGMFAPPGTAAFGPPGSGGALPGAFAPPGSGGAPPPGSFALPPGSGGDQPPFPARVLYSHAAEDAQQTTVAAGETVTVQECIGQWWRVSGSRGGGYVPVGVLQRLPGTLARAARPALFRAVAQFDFDGGQQGDLPFRAGDALQVLEARGDWWTARVREGGFEGQVPGNYLRRDDSLPASPMVQRGGGGGGGGGAYDMASVLSALTKDLPPTAIGVPGQAAQEQHAGAGRAREAAQAVTLQAKVERLRALGHAGAVRDDRVFNADPPRVVTPTERGDIRMLECTDVTDLVLEPMQRFFDAANLAEHCGIGRDNDNMEHDCFKVVRVDLLHNGELLQDYEYRRERLKSNQMAGLRDTITSTGNPFAAALGLELDKAANEVLVFHGTAADAVPIVAETGFDFRLSATTNNWFGAGIYAAENITKSDEYCSCSSHDHCGGHWNFEQKRWTRRAKDFRTCGDLYVFVNRMTMGTPYVAKENKMGDLRRPPCIEYGLGCDNPRCSHTRYDSIMALPLGTEAKNVSKNRRFFKEFIVFENSQIYAEYLVTFRRAKMK